MARKTGNPVQTEIEMVPVTFAEMARAIDLKYQPWFGSEDTPPAEIGTKVRYFRKYARGEDKSF